MRIISGELKGKKLFTLAGDNTRPTLDNVKEAIFNILGNIFYDKAVLDLFSGSGALGLEAISRGARKCVFSDVSKDAVKVIEANIEACKLKDKAEVFNDDFQNIICKFTNKDFSIVFLDPPYGKDMGLKALKLLENAVSDDAVIVLETDYSEDVPDNVGIFEKYDFRKYGRTAVSFFRKEGFVDGGS